LILPPRGRVQIRKIPMVEIIFIHRDFSLHSLEVANNMVLVKKSS